MLKAVATLAVSNYNLRLLIDLAQGLDVKMPYWLFAGMP